MNVEKKSEMIALESFERFVQIFERHSSSFFHRGQKSFSGGLQIVMLAACSFDSRVCSVGASTTWKASNVGNESGVS